MIRREFIALAGGAVATSVAGAQQPASNIPRIAAC
jgi:hypothetical protein